MVPDDDEGVVVEVAGSVKAVADGLVTIALEVTCGGQKVLGHAQGCRCVPELLRDHTTLRLGGPAGAFVTATTEDELVEAVRRADDAGDEVLVVSGGSNLVVADEGFPGTVVEVATRGVSADVEDGATRGGVLVTVAAGESGTTWSLRAVESGWIGIEALSGIPGAVGATPIQNVGAYGQEVAQTIASVRVYDRQSQEVRTIAAADCGFGYRTASFKADPGRYVVLT